MRLSRTIFALSAILASFVFSASTPAQTTLGGTATLGVSAASAITVQLTPPTGAVATSATRTLALTLINDSTNAGANFTLSGPGCSGATCGSLSLTFARTGQTLTYTAPTNAPTPGTVNVTATSVQDPTRFTISTLSITGTIPPAIVNNANVGPALAQAAASVNTFPITATVGNAVIVSIGIPAADVISSVQVCNPSAVCTTLTQACPPSGPCFGATSPGGESFQYYAFNLTSGQTSIVVNNSTPSGTVDIGVLDVSGIGTFDTASVSSNQTTPTSTPTGPSVTPNSSGELVVGFINNTGTITGVGAPFTFAAMAGGEALSYTVIPNISAAIPSYTASSAVTWSGFIGAYKLGTTPQVIRVSVAPAAANVQVNATKNFTATVTNDNANGGVNWTKTGASCAGATCGTISSTTSASGVAITYTAPAAVPGASVSRVQHVSSVVNANPSTQTITSSASGDILCAMATWTGNVGTLAITDNLAQSWPAVILSGGSSGASFAIQCMPNTASGVTGVTFTVSGASPTTMEIYVVEYAGVATSTPVDQFTSAAYTTNATADSGLTATTTNANDVLIGFGYNGSANSFTAGTDGNGDSYTILEQHNAIGSAMEDFFTTTATNTYKAVMTADVAGGGRMGVVALKASAAGSASVSLTATSVSDGSKTATATITIGATAIVGVSLSPSQASIIAGNGTLSITPTVANDPGNNGVTFALNGPGSISATSGPSGTPVVYTPPATVSGITTAILTATSVLDGTKSATATITIQPTVGPPTCAGGNCPAFTGVGGTAQGSGAGTPGGSGRNGTGTPVVYEVTSLLDDGSSGTLRACVQATGPRTCVFRVAGYINLRNRMTVSNPYLTVAGQTAPGGGIWTSNPAITDAMWWIQTHDVVIRYIGCSGANQSIAPGPSGGTGCFLFQNANNYNDIVDHVSMRWWGNKGLIFGSNGGGGTHDVTAQWNLVYEPNVGHPVCWMFDDIDTQALLDTNEDGHHNVFINCDHRMPMWNTKSGRWVNNLVYDYGSDAPTGFAFLSQGGNTVDIINNLYVGGNIGGNVFQPFMFNNSQSSDSTGGMPGPPSHFMSGNAKRSSPFDTTGVPASQLSLTSQGSEGGQGSAPAPSGWLRNTQLAALTFPITADPAVNLDNVLLGTVGNSQHLDCTGNWLNNRNSQDARVINQYKTNGNGAYFSYQFTDPALITGSACTSTQHDGIADAWKTKYGLSTSDPNLWKSIDPVTGYTYLEDYINGLVP